MKLETLARELIKGLKGRMGPSPYDIAWMARVPSDTGDGKRWPDLINWLLEHQLSDGSWGGVICYYHDRILCTLVAIIALKEQEINREVEQAIKRGERYIWHNLHRLRHDPFELVGFELLLPTLIIDALDLGLDVPQHTCGYGRTRKKKLDLIPPDMLYSPKITTVHSLEFLGKDSDLRKMQQAVGVNGSLGNSPATTSYYLLQGAKDNRAIAYLENMLAHNQHVIYLHPFRAFELAWVLHSFSICSEGLKNLTSDSVWTKLQDNLGERGTGLDPTFGIEDSDTTSVTMLLLKLAGYPVNSKILARFEDKETLAFRTYDYERNISISTNAHALEALSLLSDYPEREKSRDHITAFLLANRTFDTYWTDKWHASPYYATAHVLVGITRATPRILDECHRTIAWLAHTQKEDGSWGFFNGGTLEETAYALIALLYSSRRFPINKDILRRGAAYLLEKTIEQHNDHHPPLWLGKSLYIPHDIVQAAILAALMLYKDTFGSL